MEQTVSHTNFKNLDGISRIQQDLRTGHTGDTPMPDMVRTAVSRSRQVHVGIVGAGFSGLRCADVLLQHGCKVTILEARNRLGGRVAQSTHLGHAVDLGPNWIHGSENNPIMKLAKETDTELHAWDEDSYILDSTGKVVSTDEGDKCSELLWEDGVIAAAFRYSNEYQSTIDPNKSLYDFFVEKAETMFEDEEFSVAKSRRERFLQFASMWGSYVGSPVTRQSLKFFWLEECIEGENPFVAGTYRKIFEAIAEPAQRGADVKLNTEVVIINGLQDVEGHERELTSIETADGTKKSFDEIVVTAPLGWLKTNLAAFYPPLPPRLSAAINNISYGTLDKVYITFPKAFWETSGLTRSHPPSSSVDQEKTTPNITATTIPLHQPPSKDRKSHFPGFIHWLQPEYAFSTNPDRWFQDGMNFAALRPDCAHPTLSFYIQGPVSSHVGGLVASAKTDEERDQKLSEFFEPYYSLLPNFSKANPECEPKALLATAWVNDKFAGYGSYANFQIGLENGDKDIEVMRDGMPERHIWLAGEHTAPFIALGTSTGAYWSGEAVARRIAEAYQLKEKDGGA